MAEYFGLRPQPEASANDLDVSIVQNFPPERVFNLVGSNPADYLVMRGMSAWAAGDKSDGLVRMENATTHGPDTTGKDVRSPSAYAYRSHSGHYGIVNSEEGYQNLTRFFFGSLRVDGILDIDEVILPDGVEQERAKGRDIKASYQFEIVAAVRGTQWHIHRRTVRENSAIHRMYDELFPKPSRTPDRTRSPHLFSVFLDPRKSMDADEPLERRTVAFSFDLAVLVPDYQIDGVLWLNQHFEGGFLYREQVVVEAIPDAQGEWTAQYRFQGDNTNAGFSPLPLQPVQGGGFDCVIPVVRDARPGIKAKLRIEARPWNA